MQMCTRYGCQIVACVLEQYLQINTGQVTFVFRWECGTINKHEGVNAAYSKIWAFLCLFCLFVGWRTILSLLLPCCGARWMQTSPSPQANRWPASHTLVKPKHFQGQTSTTTPLWSLPAPVCVLRGPNPGSVINFAQAVKHSAAVQLEQQLPPLPPPRHPRGPTLLQEILLMSTTGLGSRIKTQQPEPDPLLPLTAARSSAWHRACG